MISKLIENFERFSKQLEEVITGNDRVAIRTLDVAVQSEFESLLQFQKADFGQARALIVFLVERLQPLHLRSPLEMRISEKITDLISDR